MKREMSALNKKPSSRAHVIERNSQLSSFLGINYFPFYIVLGFVPIPFIFSWNLKLYTFVDPGITFDKGKSKALKLIQNTKIGTMLHDSLDVDRFLLVKEIDVVNQKNDIWQIILSRDELKIMTQRSRQNSRFGNFNYKRKDFYLNSSNEL